MKPLIVIGIILVIAGLIGLAYPAFTTAQNKEVAKVGPLHLQEHEEQTHFVPPLLSGGVIVLGFVLLGTGLVRQ